MCHGLDIADKRRGVKVKFSVRWCLALALRQNLLDFLLAMLVVTERGDLFGAVAALVHDGDTVLVGFSDRRRSRFYRPLPPKFRARFRFRTRSRSFRFWAGIRQGLYR